MSQQSARWMNNPFLAWQIEDDDGPLAGPTPEPVPLASKTTRSDASEMGAVPKGVTALEAAREYTRRGWSVVPIPRGKKAPNLKGWQNLRLTEGELSGRITANTNLGLLLGEPSGGLIDVDLDAPEAIAVADSFLPKTSRLHGRPSKVRSHRWYRVSPSPEYLKLVDPTRRESDAGNSTIVELRQDGHQTVVPPSLHDSGELYGWDEEGEPANADASDLFQRVHNLAAAALLGRYWSKGQRHAAALALSGMLLRAGWDDERVSHFVGAVAAAAGDEEQSMRMSDVFSTAERQSTGRPTTGAPTLAEIVGDVVVQQVREWLGIARYEVRDPQDWPDPAPLGDELPLVQAFSPELLPSSLRPLVEDLSERMQTPLDFAGAAATVALAGCVNRRAIIYPKAVDDSWAVVPNLWGAIVAPPGFMKSPVLHAVTRPLAKIQEDWHAEYEQQLSEYERTREEDELKLQAWREQSKREYKAGKAGLLRPDVSASLPAEKRLLLTDSTYEKLHEILSQNPAGVLVVRDELTGWLAGLDRQGHEGERGFYLQCWNGDEGFWVDRIGRGSIFVPAACVSLFGNIQPARLRCYLADVTSGGPNDDGLFQRFQVLVWPDPPRNWKNIDRKPSGPALLMAEKILGTLAALSAEEPIRMNFDPDAQQLFNEWFEELERLIRSEQGLSPFMVGHLSKYRSLMPTLAGLFELADRVSAGKEMSGRFSITLNHAKQAAAFCEYLESHARRVYSCVISPECRAARELARHIQANDVAEIFTPRSIYLKGWTGLDTPERVRGALTLLEDAGWVRRMETTSSPSGGRPSENWLINPKVVRDEK
jgi:hypothetical protein